MSFIIPLYLEFRDTEDDIADIEKVELITTMLFNHPFVLGVYQAPQVAERTLAEIEAQLEGK